MLRNKNLMLFSRNLTSVIGGSELSLLQALKKVENDYDKIFIMSFFLVKRKTSYFQIMR